MSSGFKLKMNPFSQVLKDHGWDRDGKASEHLRDTVERLSRPFVPGGAAGMLSKLVVYPSKHEIKYTSPYAHYQYMGKLYLAKNGSSWAKKGESKFETNTNLKYHTSGTGAKWEQLMLQRRKSDLVKDMQNFIKRGG